MRSDRSGKSDQNRVNEQIRSVHVFLIDEEGGSVGKIDTSIALKMAKDKELDLVQVAYNKQDNLPVCKILDYGKLKYDKTKGKSKSKTKSQQQKEIKIGFNIAQHDLDIKLNQIKKFLSKGFSVKYSLQLKGRQKGNKDAALELFYNSLDSLSDFADWDRPKVSSNNMLVILTPKKP
tara:strand:- start:184 stop:714 length:531 start_codon:yes stop_codon:yes gene_type:complete